MKIYYAHSRMKYNTMIEQYELALIRQKFPEAEIINPNGTVDQTLPEGDIMQECYKLIGECNMLVFSSISGVIGKGVYYEIVEAYACDVKLYKMEKLNIGEYTTMPNIISRWRKRMLAKDISPDMIYAVVL